MEQGRKRRLRNLLAACLVPVILTVVAAFTVLPVSPGLIPFFVAWFVVCGLLGLVTSRSWWLFGGLSVIIALPLLVVVVLINYEPMQVNGLSMQPTLQPDDVVLVDRRAHRIDALGLYVIRRSTDPDRVMVKRAVGLPGQTLEARDGRLYADGVEVHPRVGGTGWNDERSVYAQFNLAQPMTLGPDEYFFIGDNPGSSRDSRREGPYSASQIEGRVIWRLKGHHGIGPLTK
jgi:signal peptidase I